MTLQQTFFRLFLACLTCVSLSCAAKDCYASEEKELAYVESTYSKSSYNIRGSKAIINKAEVNMDRFVSRDISQGTTGRITMASVNNHIQEVGCGEFSEDKNGAGVHIKEQMYEDTRISDKDRIMVASMWGNLKAEVNNNTDKSSASHSYDTQESTRLSFEETGLTKRKYQGSSSGKNPYRDLRSKRDKNDIHGAVPEPMSREERMMREEKFAARRKKTKINKERMGGTLGQTVVGTFGDILLKVRDMVDLSFSVEERFDDNIFGTWDGKKVHDFITTVSPVVTISFDRSTFSGILFKEHPKSDLDVFPQLEVSLSVNMEYYMLNPKLNNQGDADSFFQPNLRFELYPDENLRLFYQYDFQRQNITQIDPLGDSKRQEKVNTTTYRYGFDYAIGSRRGAAGGFSDGNTSADNRGRGQSGSFGRGRSDNAGGQFGNTAGGDREAELTYEHTSTVNKGGGGPDDTTDSRGEGELEDFDNTTDRWSLTINMNNSGGNSGGNYQNRNFRGNDQNWNAGGSNQGFSLPKIFLEYEGESSTLGSNSNQKKVTHDFFVGMNGNFSPKINGTAKAGYGFAVPNARNVFSFKDVYSDFVTEIELNYQVAPRVGIGANFDRSLGNISSFVIDEGGEDMGSGVTDTLNVPRQTREEWSADLSVNYIPPFFSDNLTLTADISHREIRYSDGSRQKVQDLGLSYSYVWTRGSRDGTQNNNFGGNNQNRNIQGGNQNRNFGGNNQDGRRSKNRPLRWWSDWEFEGEVRTRKASPEESWSRFSHNEFSLTLTTEF